MRNLGFIAIALLVAAATTATVVAAYRGSTERPCVADPSLTQCSASTDCNAARPACQPQHQSERLRAYCADHPRDAKCHT